MKSYSLDLREKVFESYEKSRSKDKYKIAKRFKVSYDFVNDLVNLHKETGSLNPKPFRGGRKPKINEELGKYLILLVNENNDRTLVELCELLNTDKGVSIGTTGMFTSLRKLGLTLKKKHTKRI